jgi:L-threonylcarbamoyladenylate synthase
MAEIIQTITKDAYNYILRALNNGGIVSFPTETVYALVADASNDEAVQRLYSIKKRATVKPFSLLVGDIYQAKRMVHFNEPANKLAVNFMPGPITLILRKKEHANISKYVNNNIETIGIRMPNHQFSLHLLRLFDRALVGTSANLSGNQSAVNATQVIEELSDFVDIIIDGGETEYKNSSTIVDIADENNINILRNGVVSADRINAVINSC